VARLTTSQAGRGRIAEKMQIVAEMERQWTGGRLRYGDQAGPLIARNW